MTIFSSTHAKQFYINGQWVNPKSQRGIPIQVMDPNDGSLLGEVISADEADTRAAIAAANVAFKGWSQTSPETRAQFLEKIGAELLKRKDDLINSVCSELGCPLHLTERFHVTQGLALCQNTADLIRKYPWENKERDLIVKEALGPIAILTPWNGPITSIVKKVAMVLAAGCTAVLKPSEQTPFTAIIIAEAIEAAGLPNGVFNMLQGDGKVVGHELVSHPHIAGVTLTGSVQAGVEISKTGANTLKRLCLELGGKSANIILDDESFADAVKGGTISCMLNSGQVCFSPSRMLIPKHRLAEAESIAKAVAVSLKVGHANDPQVMIGPVISEAHYQRVRNYIQVGKDEGAQLLAGGTEKPNGAGNGYFIQPTVFTGVENSMRIAQEEIFGPVLSIISYSDLDDAIRIANDSPFGLAAHISGKDNEQILSIAKQLRVGSVFINGAIMNFDSPFGGYKMSGQGREHGFAGLEEFLETKAFVGLL